MSSIPLPKIVDKIENPDELLITPGLIRDKLKIWGNKMVNKTRDISSSNWVSPILLGLLLSYNIYTNQQANLQLANFKLESDKQHDLLTELKILREVEEKEKAQEKIDKKLDQDLERVYREKITGSMNRLELVVQGKYPNNSNNKEN